MPLIQKRMTVDGSAIASPKNIIAPIGTLINEVIQFCGGYMGEPQKIIMGGPMMGRAIPSDQMPIVKNNNAILAFSGPQSLVPEETSCINCGRCHFACPFNLIPTALTDAMEQKNAERLELIMQQPLSFFRCFFLVIFDLEIEVRRIEHILLIVDSEDSRTQDDIDAEEYILYYEHDVYDIEDRKSVV